MKRMTAKYDDGYYNGYYTTGKMSSGIAYYDEKKFTNAAIEKLGELEDIEEEQGISLFKCKEIQKSRSVVLTNEFGFARELHDVHMYIGNGEVAIITEDDGIFYYQLSQYGQTWALTKDELKAPTN